MLIKRFLSLFVAFILFLSTSVAAQADELLWNEQAGQLICKELSEGLKLESDIELLAIPGMDRFKKQISANENPELLVFGQML